MTIDKVTGKNLTMGILTIVFNFIKLEFPQLIFTGF